jgi:hypothetical protein
MRTFAYFLGLLLATWIIQRAGFGLFDLLGRDGNDALALPLYALALLGCGLLLGWLAGVKGQDFGPALGASVLYALVQTLLFVPGCGHGTAGTVAFFLALPWLVVAGVLSSRFLLRRLGVPRPDRSGQVEPPS